MNKTNIEWCDFSANPLKYRDVAGNVVWACVKESPGCTNCYSEALAKRYGRGESFKESHMDKLTPFLDEKELHRMLTYKPTSGKRCFVGDMTDVFGDWVPDELLDRLFAVFALRSDVTWQVLTKRAERMREYMQTPDRKQIIAGETMAISNMLAVAAKSHTARITLDHMSECFAGSGPFANVWLGVSVENQQYADERIIDLVNTPATVKFLSCEPLLGPIDLTRVKTGSWAYGHVDVMSGYPCGAEPDEMYDWKADPRGWVKKPAGKWKRGDCGVDWVIVGCESGPRRRPMQERWAEFIASQCADAGVKFFAKQMEIDGRVSGDVETFVEKLRVREFPTAEMGKS